MANYRTAPASITGMPKGIPYILGNELAERFSFYGMKAILTVYMTKHLMDAAGQPDFMGDEEAKSVYHLFTAAAYFFPILGSLLADVLLGKYRTILVLSLGYCIGHAFLAMGDTGAGAALLSPRGWLFLGMAFIAVGAGGIKPCVSAHLGDQFGPKNSGLISKVFAWWYFSINVGAATSTLLTPWLLENKGAWAAFGLPGVLMALATLTFWIGRNKFVHIQPAGWKKFKEESFSPDGLRSLKNLTPLFLIFIPMFWAIFDQTGSAWVIQAEYMDRHFLGVEWLESQIQAANPIMILLLIPTFTYAIYPAMGRFFEPTPLRRIGIGLFLTAAAFGLTGMLQAQIDAGGEPNIGWQLVAYLLLTSGEVLVSITSLEFAYTQAPRKMKSFIMGVYFLGVSFGNLFTSGVNQLMTGDDPMLTLDGADYYWFFTGLMLVVAVIYVVFAKTYKGSTFVQEAMTPLEAGETEGDLKE
ncbi:POT family MFS transporter [Engelhardtia mirabilis]|uniref:Dipeptide and tripeptide permease A n=1 Tax=Engelhardtia mirabilis TaxID=2528011 RepID=A0A518BR59_9BACT|nr:Dipeptide and tripeptide permease A [Planctomycetes bacterium Pla133]QDV03790.1 Dipeptide and tripeptide permease A [Planctomycetes bacterium Pla86]